MCAQSQLLQDDHDPSWWNDEDWLMAIDLGYDESGAGDTLLVTVQIGVTEQAKKLKRKWRKELLAAGVEYFHGKEFGNVDHGVFRNLDKSERKKLLRVLSKAVQSHLAIGISAKITKSLYDQRTTQAFRSRWGTAYTFAIQMLVVSAYVYASHFELNPEFNILIEDGHRHANQAKASLLDSKKAGINFAIPSKILSLGLASKRDQPILQAADMLAYSEWQKMNGGNDVAIYDAIHPIDGRYRPELVDFDAELVEIVTGNAEKWMANRKAFGQNRRREGNRETGV